MELNGAHMVWASLVKEGVDIVFGYPGGAVIDLYDALTSYPIRHVLVRHEQGAAHAADGYARSTGKVGVCVATSGPGATNLVTGIATAYMDSVLFWERMLSRRLTSPVSPCPSPSTTIW